MDIDFNQAWDTLQTMLNNFIVSLPNIGVAIVVFILFYIAGWLSRTMVRKVSKRYQRNYNLGLVLGRLSQWAVSLLGMLIGLVIIFPRFTPAQLIQLLGLSSVAISFAFKDILENFFAGILLLLAEPFRIGDQIIVEDVEGTVETIETRATMIRTYDGRKVVVPNGDLFTSKVIVNTANPKRRLEYDFGIGYGDDLRLVKQLILEAVRETEGVLSDPAPDVLVVELGDFNVQVRARWWISPPRWSDALETRDGVLSGVKEKLTAAGVDLPFPTQQVLFHDQTEITDGNRRAQREGWPAGREPTPEPRWTMQNHSRQERGQGRE